MAKTISNLNKSQKEIINDEMDKRNVVSSSELIENIDFDLGENIIDRIEALEQGAAGSEDLLTNNKTIVGAINELFQSANNGKQLIANAIGTPLDSNDTFSAMSNDINGLLSTFKTNMINKGISINNGDKFKQLIDKIANITGGGGGKGLQFEMGTDTINIIDSGSAKTKTVSGLKFTPTYVFCFIPGKVWHEDDELDVGYTIRDLVFGSVGETYWDSGAGYFKITINDNNSFTIKTYLHGSTYEAVGNTSFTWYAIGVGEEDTTLRDTLASILQGEGVSVSDNDDMASLIIKADEEFDRQVVPAGTAVASNVLSGKTFINSTGQTITGTASISRYPVWYNPENTWTHISTAKLFYSPSNSMGSVVSGDDIYIFTTRAYCKYNTKTNVCSESITYTNVPSTSELSRGDFTVVNCNGLFYFIGGLKSYSSDRQNANNYLMTFNPSNNTWTTKANMITAINQALACVYNNKIYVFGGCTYKEYYGSNVTYGWTNKSSKYDPSTNTWTSITDVPNYKTLPPVVVNNCAYLPGTGGTTTRFKYDFNTDTYTQITSGLTLSRSVVYKNRIYSFGVGSSSSTRRTTMYDTTTGTETDKAICNVDKSGGSAHAMGDLIYYLGGDTKNSNGYYNSTYYYGDIYIPEK